MDTKSEINLKWDPNKETQWEIDYEAQTMKQIKMAVDAATAATQKRRMKAKTEARIDSNQNFG